MIKAKDVSEYILGAPVEIQPKLNLIRSIIKGLAPNAVEKISYGMPFYSYKGRLCYFAYFKDHISFFAMPKVTEKLNDRLTPYKTGKSTIRFALNKDLPIRLIKEVLEEAVMQAENN